jgi:hypothetical protein
MAFVFHRGLAIPLWAVAFVAVALTAPPRPIPLITILLGIAVIAFTLMAAVVLIPGAREPGVLTTFGRPPANVRMPDGPSTMDTATTAERQREGGGAPSRRHPRRASVTSKIPGAAG